MAPTAAHRWLTILLLAGCSAFGAYATFGAATQNGLLEAITNAVGKDVKLKSRHIPGGPTPYKTTYTGIAAIDDPLLVLVAFFTIILDGPKTLDTVWVVRYLTAHFLAGWVIITLEGLREGNKGRIVSWTGTLGFFVQNITYTVSVPIYLIIHLLTSPISSPNVPPSAFAIPTQDLYVLPLSVTGAHIVPTIMMSLPAPSTIPVAAHYTWQAIWQVFPVTQSISHSLYKRLTAPLAFKPNFHAQLDDIYRALALLCFVPQTALLAVAATPAHLVPAALLDLNITGLTRELFAEITLARVFVPHLPWASPVVTGSASKITAAGLPELVKMFLQWDIYLGGTAILVWTAFVYSVARPDKSFVFGTFPKMVVYTVLGGPVGAATMLLWSRDVAARQRTAQSVKRQ